MGDVIDLVVAFPAVVFTALLAFSIAWWLVSMLAGGLDVDGLDGGDAGGDVGGGDVDVDAGIDGGPDTDGAIAGRIIDTIGIPGLPLSISFTIISFGAWVVALALTAAARAADLSGPLLGVVGAGAILAALFAGIRLARLVAGPLAPLFVTLQAASVDDAIGALARVRSIVVDADGVGEVLVTSGPARSTVLRARARESFPTGAIVHVIDRDDDGVYVVTAVDPALSDKPGTPGL